MISVADTDLCVCQSSSSLLCTSLNQSSGSLFTLNLMQSPIFKSAAEATQEQNGGDNEIAGLIKSFLFQWVLVLSKYAAEFSNV